jgi:3-oxoacyl-(acyl-carrier-protein) synthase
MSRRQPVITGTGIICAAGCGIREVWEAIRQGRSGLDPLTLFALPRYSNHLVGQVRGNVDALAGDVRGSRSDKLAWIAAQEALRRAGWVPGWGGLRPERLGVALGCTVGGMLGTEQFLARLLREHQHRFGPLRFHECASAADLGARHLGARGPCATFSTACSAGAMAMAAAAEWIEAGEADLVLAGGSDSLCRLTLSGFGSLLLLDPNGCRPFDARRTGISLGEGAGMLVLEAEETARARGARILARLSGWGATCDAFHATAPHPEGHGALAAMQGALQRAGLQAGEIDYVSAHGTGTPDNDAMEAKALKRLFGGPLPPVASVKRFFGHTLAASGAIQAVLCVEALQEQALPPNPGFETADPKLGLAPVKEFRAQKLTHLLSNSFGFGGNNVALVFSRFGVPASAGAACAATGPADSATPPPAEAGTTSASPVTPVARFAVVGAGVVSAAGCSFGEVRGAFERGGAAPGLFDVPSSRPPAQARVYACGDFGAEQILDPGKRRKLSRLQQMALVAARRSLPAETLAQSSPDRVCVALGTGLGSLNDTAAFLENMVEQRAPRPLFFTNSVHNALASQVAIELGLTGLNSTPIQREISFETALWQGATQITNGRAQLALVGAADELNAYHLAAGMRWRWWNDRAPEIRPFTAPRNRQERPLPGEGCAIFSLAHPGIAARPLAFVAAIRIGRVATVAGEQIDAQAEAQWILETLERGGASLSEVDLLLTGANGWPWLDHRYRAVADALSRQTGRPMRCGAYKQGCGEHHSASAFGFFTALGLVRGEIPPALCVAPADRAGLSDGPCHKVILYTLSPSGTKGMCCVCA